METHIGKKSLIIFSLRIREISLLHIPTQGGRRENFMYIGKSKSGYEITWDISGRHNFNNFALLTGKSGCGKTTLCKMLAKGASEDGLAVLIMDYSGSYYEKEITDLYPRLNYINIERDGLGLKPFQPCLRRIEESLREESREDIVCRITDVICTGYRLRGARQRCLVRQAAFSVLYTYGKDADLRDIYYATKDDALRSRLFGLTRNKEAKERLDWNQLLQPGTVTVLQLSDADIYNRLICTELLLADLWNRTEQRALREYMICLDEIQNLSFKPDSTLAHMLREARKYSVSMLLSTQFISGSNSDMRELLEQAALRFCFKPSDSEVRATAKTIDSVNDHVWAAELQNLKIGQYVFKGSGVVGDEPRDMKAVLSYELRK